MKIINGKLVTGDDSAGAEEPLHNEAERLAAVAARKAATAAAHKAAQEALATESPTEAQLRAMLGDKAAQEPDLNIVCKLSEYESLLAAKVDVVRGLFAADEFASKLQLPDIEINRSPSCFFRQRAEFRTWHTGKWGTDEFQMFYAMFPKSDPRRPVEIPAFPMGARRVNELMARLREAVLRPDAAMLREKLYEVRFLTTLRGDSLITMIYHKPIDERWTAAATPLAQELGVSLVGRSRKRKLVIGKDHVTETLQVCGESFSYRQTEGAFSQPNGAVCEKMLTFAVKHTRDSKSEDLLELYCGNGNFTAPLSRNFRKVLATEIAKPSVDLARHNMRENGCSNVTVEKKDSEDFSKAFSGAREMKFSVPPPMPGETYAPLARPTLGDFDLQTLFVDPPRAGMDELTCSVAATFKRLVYISCNPETMARDIGRIVKQLPNEAVSIEHFAVFDQFPYTHHLECGAIVKISNPKPRVGASTMPSSGSSGVAVCPSAEEQRERLQCVECGEKFATRNALFRHLDESKHGGGAQPGDSPAVAYIKTHRQKWISWLTAQNIHHTGVDHARHSTEVHERFFAAAAAEAEDVGQDPAAKRQKTTEST